MIWKTKDEQNEFLINETEWIPLDDYKEIEKRAGVYILADDQMDVKYIGRAGARRLVLEHLQVYEIYSAICRGKDDGATIIKAIYTNSNDHAKKLEEILIGIYKPKNNIYLKAED